MKTALIVSGGWEGHKPEALADRFDQLLTQRDFKVEHAASLEALKPGNDLGRFDVIIPNWTMGTLEEDSGKNLSDTVRQGTGLAGVHGGMGDAFRGHIDYEWMVGGHFVGHPHVGDYRVEIVDGEHEITRGLPSAFTYRSEEYYLLVDPANHVLAEAAYENEGVTCKMPIAWTKSWGHGRIFYSSLGHDPREFDAQPAAMELAVRGICWAATSCHRN